MRPAPTLRPCCGPLPPRLLQLNLRLTSPARARIAKIQTALPPLTGEPICVYSAAKLRAHRGKLLSTHAGRGTPVHAACFIKEREIVLETELFRARSPLPLILVHEIFHFVWTRLPNRARREFSDLLRREFASHARGELGESAEVKKTLLSTADLSHDSAAWRNYVCESFCDTAAWLYSGIRRHAAFTLAPRWRDRRKKWFEVTAPRSC